jgi:hypothetical protein
VRRLLKPSVWLFYLVFVLEILLMISPAALYFYGVYGAVLNVFHRWAATAWLTQFFLPHFSETRSIALNAIPGLAGPLMLFGVVLFLAGAIPVYWSKLRGGRSRPACTHGSDIPSTWASPSWVWGPCCSGRASWCS